jgi:signal transduction histidine kinase
MARDLLMGMLHIDCSASAHSYTQEQLRLMSAIGQMTGLVIQNARLVQQQMKTARLAATGETVAYLSHSIKNILQGMQAGADVVEMALKTKDLDILGRGWGMVQRNLTKIMRLTMNMLNFSKDRQPNLQSSHLNQIVSDAVATLQKKAVERHVEVRTEFEEQMPPIPLDPDGISQVVLNLVDNAIESVQPQEGVVGVATQFHADEGIADLIVQDNGPGIERERIEEIFEPFSSTKGQAGTGLGLPVARKIVREHHGRTVVDSEPGKGTTFRIRLPAQQRTRESEKTYATPG